MPGDRLQNELVAGANAASLRILDGVCMIESAEGSGPGFSLTPVDPGCSVFQFATLTAHFAGGEPA